MKYTEPTYEGERKRAMINRIILWILLGGLILWGYTAYASNMSNQMEYNRLHLQQDQKVIQLLNTTYDKLIVQQTLAEEKLEVAKEYNMPAEIERLGKVLDEIHEKINTRPYWTVSIDFL